MTMQTVSLLSLEPGRANPRKAMDRNGLEGLAASIRNDGLLRNLVVRPVMGRSSIGRLSSTTSMPRRLRLSLAGYRSKVAKTALSPFI